jgi:hypothetical protein
VTLTIDWDRPESMISRFFSVHEAIWLPSWRREADEDDGLNERVKAEILRLAGKLDTIRERIGVPIVVHCWYRPPAYNRFIGGAKESAHMCSGPWSAVDFSAAMPGAANRGESCDKIKAMVLPWLQELDLRMENNGQGATWVHVDTKPIVLSRYFKP